MITKTFDDFVHNRMMWENHTIFIAKLCNGEEVYDDSGREGMEPSYAWYRLKQYVVENQLWIVDLTLKYKSHVITIPSNKDGYYLGRGNVANVSDVRIDRSNYFIPGYYEDGKILREWYKIPELESMETDEIGFDINHPALIMKPEYYGKTE